MDHDVLTLAEAAEYLRIHVNTALKLAAAGRIPGRKVGHSWRFSRAKLQAYIDAPQPMPGRRIKAA